MTPSDKDTRRRRRGKLLLPAALAVTLLGGSVMLSGCGDDSDSRPDTVSQRDTALETAQDSAVDTTFDSPTTFPD